MSLLTIAEVQALGIGVGLSDATLQSIIDREESELTRLFGDASAARTETTKGGGCSVFLRRAISSVSSISEYYYMGDTATVLIATDYYVWGDEGRIERISTASKWGALVAVTYTPVDDTNLRKSVLLELIRIGSEESVSGGESVSGLGFSVGATSTASALTNPRAALYARMGWLDR